MLLAGKTAVIYGGGGSIGAAAGEVFAREGAYVALAGRTLDPLERTREAIRAQGGRADAAVVDALDEDAVTRHLADVAREQGHVDLVLNAIGADHVQGIPIGETSLEQFLEPVVTYLTAAFVTAKAAAEVMTSQGSGVIQNISTPGARLGGMGIIGNAAQSAGLEGFSRALAAELGPAGVRVLCVRPHALAAGASGSYTRRMFGRIAARAGMSTDDWLSGAAAGSALGHLPGAQDVAEYLAFAASDRAAAMTGVVGNLTAGAILD
ncbi:SDR family NAD(P)-dependent oxidoreductase [Microbacterium lushaniae]|uniref:SDR family oxidoreductase n=1 Tax=Microbacterium lushaniae TaxID=2614639 RepID=A0A5J6L758_9MICO|nr:SDR family oxidoreductase [Microbacterium lushaniae]QEW04268.1 SDR family oxidoreductase [Microbacterium lushaniae]